MTDQEGYRAWITGDVAACEQYLGELTPRLHGYALRLLRNSSEAEDIVQEALLAALEKTPDCSDGGSFRAWLYKVVHHKTVDHLRRHSRWVQMPESDEDKDLFGPKGRFREPVEAWSVAPDETLAARQILGMVKEALPTLPHLQREALVLSTFQELTPEQVAHILDITPGHFRVLLHRARMALRRAVDQRLKTPSTPSPAMPETLQMGR